MGWSSGSSTARSTDTLGSVIDDDDDDRSSSSSASMAHSFEELDVQGDNAREVLPACREAVGISLGKSTESRTAGRPRFQLGPLPLASALPRGNDDLDTPTSGRRGLRTLNLSMISHESIPKDETRLKQEKLAKYEVLCSEVSKGICIGGEKVASNRAQLKLAGITHIVNCVGMIVPDHFPQDFAYQTLYLRDVGMEDLTSLFYQVFDFIEAAKENEGKVLVHCMQGVSRSVTFVIAYLMWSQNKPYGEVFEAVKEIRGIANPNIGFCLQLRTWKLELDRPPEQRAFLISRHSENLEYRPLLIAKRIRVELSPQLLQNQQVILLHLTNRQYIWRGSDSMPADLEAAEQCARLFSKYEEKTHAELIRQGSESEDFRKAFKLPLQRPPCVPKVKLALVARSGSAMNSARSDQSTPKSAKSKTPRTERSALERSPRRKSRRSDNSDSSRENHARGLHSEPCDALLPSTRSEPAITARSHPACTARSDPAPPDSARSEGSRAILDVGHRLWAKTLHLPHLFKLLSQQRQRSRQSPELDSAGNPAEEKPFKDL